MSGLLPLRPLQERAISSLRDSLRSGKRRPIIQAPTGFGKTVLAAHIVQGALNKGKRVGFTVSSIGLIDQTIERFQENGIDVRDIGVMQGNHPLHRPDAPIQICSIQTVGKRGRPNVDFVVSDEVHLRFAALEHWLADEPSKIFVGLSATPWSRGLAEIWDDLIIPTTIKELIEQKWLSPFKAFAPSHPDLVGVPIVSTPLGSDYHQQQLAERMSKATIVADVVQTWLAKAERRPTLVFAVDRAHADLLHQQFEAAGVSSVYVDAFTDRYDRAAIGRRLNKGMLDVVCSVGTMTHGIDLDVRCIVLARPTRSEILLTQMVGRGLRAAEGKDHLLLLDHSDSTLNLGMVTDIKHERLRHGKRPGVQEIERPTPKPRECVKCACLVPPSALECPHCGYRAPRPISTVTVTDGELIEFEKAAAQKKLQKKENRTWSFEEKCMFFGQLKGYLADHPGWKPGWAATKYKEKFGVYPSGDYGERGRVEDNSPTMPCGPQVKTWLKKAFIAWANKRDKNEVSI
jgi:DNA repair protein RadD